jgi:hypothetical protein
LLVEARGRRLLGWGAAGIWSSCLLLLLHILGRWDLLGARA